MSQATDMLAAYIAAETAVLQGQQVRFGERFLGHADLAEIRAGRAEWQRKVNAEQASASGRSTFGGLGMSVARLDGQ